VLFDAVVFAVKELNPTAVLFEAVVLDPSEP